VVVLVLNELQERLILWEMSMSVVIEVGEGKAWEEGCLHCLAQDMWTGRHR